MRRLALAAPAILLAGCLVVVDDRRHPPSPPPPPPPAHVRTEVAVVYTASWHDTRYVVWREYYDCDDYEVYYCESLHGYDDDDLLVLLYISRIRRVPLRTVVFEYDRCRRDLFSVAVAFRMTGDEFFHPAVQPGAWPPPYGRAYGYYWKRERGYRLTNEEVRALVHLRIGVEYYGYKPQDYFREHERSRAQGRPSCFREIAVRDYKQAGSGGRNIHAAPVKKADRPWEVQNRGDWERRREESRDRARIQEAKEPPRHPEAERARREFEAADKARKEEAARRAREDEEQRRRAAEDKRRLEEAQRRKEAEEDARRRAEDQRRREDEAKRAEELKRKQDELKRKEEQKRLEEQRRKEEQKRLEEQKRREEEKRQQDEHRKQEEPKKNQEEQKKKEEEQKKQKDR
jgi:hypothetical protein